MHEIQYSIQQCFLGKLLVAVNSKGICAIFLGGDANGLVQQLSEEFPDTKLLENTAQAIQLTEQLIENLQDPTQQAELPLDMQGTAFQQRVWHALKKIPRGSTLSYSDIAKQIGAPKAVRAVARACASNNLAIVIPCHRVVRQDGSISGYRWGVGLKRDLLAKEGVQLRGTA